MTVTTELGIAQTVNAQVRISAIRFANATGWTVASVTWDKGACPPDAPVGRNGTLFGLVGDLGVPPPRRGDILAVVGKWEVHPRFGAQLKAEQAVPVLGGSDEDIEAFLTHLPGFGAIRARAAIKTLGREALLAALESDDGAGLVAISGIGAETAKAAAETYKEKKGLGDALAFLTRLGLGKATLAKALEMWKGTVRRVLEADPYQLMALRGVGFMEADEIARSRLSVPRDDPRRLRAAGRLACDNVEDEGHCWLDLDEVAQDERLQKQTHLSKAEMRRGLVLLTEPYTNGAGRSCLAHLVLDEGRMWIAELLTCEREIARHLGRLAGSPVALPPEAAPLPPTPPCPVCTGTGKTGSAVCWGCNGDGQSRGMCRYPDCGRPTYILPIVDTDAAVHAIQTICGNTHTEWRGAQPRPAEADGANEAGELTESCALETPLDAWDGITPAPEQAVAIEAMARNRLLLMTGGPGVGKTATTKAVLATLEHNKIEVACCAPTGKAAQRMAEQTGRPAMTIHRLLKYAPEQGFRHDDGEPEYDDARWIRGGPIDAGAVVLDEASMVDARLFLALLRALPDGCRLIIVGDVDQLPSIGPGRVLHDLIESQALPIVRLTKIFRQAAESAIPYVARDINQGRVPDLGGLRDVKFLEVSDPAEAQGLVVHAVANILRHERPQPDGTIRRSFDPLSEILVLSPQRKTDLGVEALNRRLQDVLNPAREEAPALWIGGGYQMRLGDRVLHTRNNYELEVFNGELGRCAALRFGGLSRTELEEAGVLTSSGAYESKTGLTSRFAVVDFGQRKVAYRKEDLADLWLGYALTVHRCQGSQAPCVVQIVHTSHTFMNTRSLVYTGATRPSEFLLMIGEAKALAHAAGNERGRARQTGLTARIRATLLPESR